MGGEGGIEPRIHVEAKSLLSNVTVPAGFIRQIVNS